jgi:hypothetical protein
MGAPQKYALQDLLQVRRLREDNAAMQWARQKDVVAAVQTTLSRRRQELADYQAWRVRREEEMFREVVNQKIHPHDLDKLRFRIQKLRDEEISHQSGVLETENQIQVEKQKLEENRKQYYAAFHRRDKLDEHKALWTRAATREREMNDEKEVEDFKNHMASQFVESV